MWLGKTIKSFFIIKAGSISTNIGGNCTGRPGVDRMQKEQIKVRKNLTFGKFEIP